MTIKSLNKEDKTAVVLLNDKEVEAMQKILDNKTVGFNFSCISNKGCSELINKINAIK